MLNIIIFFKTIIDIFSCFGNSQPPAFKSLFIELASAAFILLLFYAGCLLLSYLPLNWDSDSAITGIFAFGFIYLTILFFLLCRGIILFIIVFNKTTKYLYLRFASDKTTVR
ncbi:hypothetical protein [Snodgrassella alvi]|nr:hypothetical protein [Snodgrassella alvi]PIT13424.1 hypothetical protein BGI33_09910 [Snodgrassella alvi]PIT15712.1 hypothetical protein BGI34_10880 [Snodgrassella alvi]